MAQLVGRWQLLPDIGDISPIGVQSFGFGHA